MTDVIAHRGAHLYQRENTLAAFREALRLKVDGVELDVRRTRDGALVVHHDPDVAGGPIASRLSGDLPAYVPNLEEAMEVLRGTTVNVEIKNSPGDGDAYDASGSLGREVVECLRRTTLTSQVVISCFDLATCTRLHAYDPSIRVAWLVDDTSLVEALRVAHEIGLYGVNPRFGLVTPETQRVARVFDLAINVWTPNKAKHIRAMAELGVNGIITDQPALALELLADGPPT